MGIGWVSSLSPKLSSYPGVSVFLMIVLSLEKGFHPIEKRPSWRMWGSLVRVPLAAQLMVQGCLKLFNVCGET